MKQQGTIFTNLFRPLRWLVGFLVPKNERLWVFGSYSGKRYADNSRQLFDFISKQHGFQAIWLTNSRAIKSEIEKDGLACALFYSWKGIITALRARFAVVSFSSDDIGPFCYLNSYKLTIINLYHGTPLKILDSKVEADWLTRLFRKALLVVVGRKYDYVCCASETAATAMNQHFKISADAYKITGQPRNDALFSSEANDFVVNLQRELNFSKVILYLPTFRDYKIGDSFPDLFSSYGFSAADFLRVMEEKRAVFLIKLHPHDAERARDVLSGFKGGALVRLVSDSDIGNLYSFLQHVDVLVTDYSSVYFDFLLLNRPIIFTPFDLDEYSRKRGFYYDYGSVTPGPKAKNWGEALAALEQALSEPDVYAGERKRVCAMFNDFQDGQSSKRVLGAVLKEVGL